MTEDADTAGTGLAREIAEADGPPARLDVESGPQRTAPNGSSWVLPGSWERQRRLLRWIRGGEP